MRKKNLLKSRIRCPDRYSELFFMMDEIQKLFIENGQKDYYLAMIDIDNFKNINDTYGHNTGDDALKILAKTIILQAQKHGFKYCRWGGEEFLLLGKCRSGEIPKDILEELRSAISSNCVRTSRESFRYTVTIGAGKYTSGQSAKEWLDFVDKQLYKGKRSEKTRSYVHKRTVTKQEMNFSFPVCNSSFVILYLISMASPKLKKRYLSFTAISYA